MLNFLAVGAGGFIGAAARYAVSLIPLDCSGVFPVNTLIINVLGAFIIGIITAAAAKNAGLSPRMSPTRLFRAELCSPALICRL